MFKTRKELEQVIRLMMPITIDKRKNYFGNKKVYEFVRDFTEDFMRRNNLRFDMNGDVVRIWDNGLLANFDENKELQAFVEDYTEQRKKLRGFLEGLLGWSGVVNKKR